MTEDILKQIRKEYFTKKREIEKLKEKRDRLKALEKCSEVQEYLNLLGCISLINDNQNEILTDDEILYSTYRKYIYKSQHTNNIYVYVGAFKRTSDGDILVSNSPFDYKLYQDVENEFNKVYMTPLNYQKFERDNRVIIPMNPSYETYYQIRREFIHTAIKEDQDLACQKILHKKY